VQTLVVVDVKLTGNPELAVALNEDGDAGRLMFAGLLNVMVWVDAGVEKSTKRTRLLLLSVM
jgi:hypothetical protein